MAEKMNPPPGSEAADDEARDMRNALARRLAVAGGLVAILLGLLGVFEHFSQAPDDDEAPVFTRPVPVAPKKLVTQPLTPADDLPEPPVTATAPAPADSSSATAAATPGTAAPGTVEPITTGPRGGAPNDNPPDGKKAPAAASTATVAAAPATPAATPAAPLAPPRAASEARPAPAREPAVVPEKTISPPLAPPAARPALSPTPESAAASVAAVPPPAPARIVDVVPGGSIIARPGAGFVLQAGVFTSAERAEELHARLSLNGIPSTIETRVQVGPFRTRQEAMAAQRKLRELGVDSLLITPKGER